MMSDGYGRKLSDSFAFYDPEASCWRTSQVSLLPDSTTSSVDWPRAGMTRNGTAYRRQPSALPTDATAFSLLVHEENFPTPRSFSEMAATITPESVHNPKRRRGNLETEVGRRLWPTPTARDHKDGTAASCANVPVNSLLGREVHQNPQPGQSGSLNPQWVEWLMGFPEGWTDLEHSETP